MPRVFSKLDFSPLADSDDSVINLSVKASDPSAPVEGDLWYNGTDNRVKYSDGSNTRLVPVELQELYSSSSTTELFPSFFAKTIEADTNSLVFLATQNPAFPIGQFVFTTPPATGGANTQILSVVNQSTINAAMSVSNEAGSASSNLFYVGNSGTISSAHSIFQNTSTGSSSGILAAQNAGTVADYISLIQAADGSTNSGQAFLVIQNLDTASGNDIPLIRLNHLAGTATGDAVDIQFTLRTADPTNLVDGGMWYNTTDDRVRYTNGTDTLTIATVEGDIDLQAVFDGTTGSTNYLGTGVTAKILDPGTEFLVVRSNGDYGFPFPSTAFVTEAAQGSTNTQTMAAASFGTTNVVFAVSNEATGTTTAPLFVVNKGALSANGAIAVVQADNGSTNGGVGLLAVYNYDTLGGNNVPLIRLNHFAGGTGTGDAVDIQFTARTADPTNLVDGGLWFNTTDNALKSSDGTGLFRVITAEESQSLGPWTVDKHTINRPLVFAASAQAVPTGSTIFYNDVANANSIPLAVINNAAAGFGAVWDNMTGASLTVLAQFQNTGTVNAPGAVVAIQSQDGSTNNGQALLVVQNQDSLGGNDVPLIKLNHLAGTGTGDAVDIQFTARTSDPTNLVDGGLWFNTTDNQMKFSDGVSTYPLAHLEDGTNRGSLNLPVLAADPISPQDGDVWLFDDTATRAIRARMGGVTYSVTLT